MFKTICCRITIVLKQDICASAWLFNYPIWFYFFFLVVPFLLGNEGPCIVTRSRASALNVVCETWKGSPTWALWKNNYIVLSLCYIPPVPFICILQQLPSESYPWNFLASIYHHETLGIDFEKRHTCAVNTLLLLA